jgi:hypothetical protein
MDNFPQAWNGRGVNYQPALNKEALKLQGSTFPPNAAGTLVFLYFTIKKFRVRAFPKKMLWFPNYFQKG